MGVQSGRGLNWYTFVAACCCRHSICTLLMQSALDQYAVVAVNPSILLLQSAQYQCKDCNSLHANNSIHQLSIEASAYCCFPHSISKRTAIEVQFECVCNSIQHINRLLTVTKSYFQSADCSRFMKFINWFYIKTVNSFKKSMQFIS